MLKSYLIFVFFIFKVCHPYSTDRNLINLWIINAQSKYCLVFYWKKSCLKNIKLWLFSNKFQAKRGLKDFKLFYFVHFKTYIWKKKRCTKIEKVVWWKFFKNRHDLDIVSRQWSVCRLKTAVCQSKVFDILNKIDLIVMKKWNLTQFSLS